MLFGKLPAHGDFVTRGLTAGERDTLDDWLTRSLDEARVRLGEHYESIYDRAPPWRFAAHGRQGWTAGVMVLSVDRVGRRYPVLVARAGLGDDAVEGAADAIEALLYQALAEGWDADRLVGAVDAGGLPATSAWTSGERWWTLGCGEEGAWMFEATSIAGARPPGLMRSVLSMRCDA